MNYENLFNRLEKLENFNKQQKIINNKLENSNNILFDYIEKQNIIIKDLKDEKNLRDSLYKINGLIELYKFYKLNNILTTNWKDFKDILECNKSIMSSSDFDNYKNIFNVHMNGLDIEKIVKYNDNGNKYIHFDIKTPTEQHEFIRDCQKFDYYNEEYKNFSNLIISELSNFTLKHLD